MEIDFPKHTHLVQVTAAQNLELKQRFKVQDPPSLFLLDDQERVIAQVSYLPENGAQFAGDLLKILEQDVELTSSLQNLKSATPNQLKKLYQLAQELSNGSALEQILEIGLTTEDPFFCLERYRLLVEKGEMKQKRLWLSVKSSLPLVLKVNSSIASGFPSP